MTITTMNRSQWFLAETVGPCRWIVRHQVTGERAGTVTRTPAGYVLTDDQGRKIGSFTTLELSLDALYDVV